MENATKALLIAAGVLIAVMIISAAIYLFVNYSEVVYNHEQNRAAQNQVQYNNKFEKFVDKTLTPQDVITIVNAAKDYNERIAINPIQVSINGTASNAIQYFYWSNDPNKNAEKINEFINEKTGESYEYEIDKIDKDSNNVIEKIIIKKKIS